ncbi:MAG: hypothetical protein NTY77_03355 [Elusimicrobia bacterium]|nr:hypothetical protein [Elusimicrobiota bacterium]
MAARVCGTAALLLGLISAQASAAPSEPQVAASTSTRAPRREIPLSLTFIQNRQDRRLELGYSLRWDFDDLKDAGPGMLRTLLDPGAFWEGQTWDFRDRTRFILYGVRVDPWKAFFEPAAPVAVTASSGTSAGAARRAPQRRRWRPSVWPVIKDINDHIESDIRNEVLRESLRRLPAEAQKRTVEDERELLRDLVRWQREVETPGLAGAADGIDYLVPQRKRDGAWHEGIHLSTASAR